MWLDAPAYQSTVEYGRISLEAVKKQMDMAEEYGTLKVAFFRMRRSGFYMEEEGDLSNYNIAGSRDQMISEKALKGKAVDCFTS